MILASQSPRRRELLGLIAPDFRVIPADLDERRRPNEPVEAYVVRLAEAKAAAVAGAAEPGEWVIAADTTVALGSEIFNKPTDYPDFLAMMGRLAGTVHQVWTGLCVRRDQSVQTRALCTEVWVRPLAEAELADYWASGEPCDKAGGYGIQGLAARFVERIEGSYTNVVGLPLVELERMLTHAP